MEHQLQVGERHARPLKIQSVNPNTGELIGTVQTHGPEEIRRAVDAGRRAQARWADIPMDERLTQMQEVQSALVDHADAIAALVAQEVGKSVTEALVGDVLLVLTSLDGYIRIARRVLRPQRLHPGLLHRGTHYQVVYEPKGVVAVISPFNFPVLLSMQSAFAALIAGNAVVHKPSEMAPLTAELIQTVLHRTGLHEALFQVVQGYGDAGWALIHAGVDHVSFVGSSSTGRKIAAAAGELLIGSMLELGGNNAMVVLKDAPLERAANAAMTFGFATSGQMCGAVARLLVHEAVMPQMKKLLSERLRKWRTSCDIRPGQSEVTALINDQAYERVRQRVESALSQGAQILNGFDPVEEGGPPLFRPTILTSTTVEMAVRREETFGPVFSLIPFENDSEGVELANETDHGLTASVWSRDLERAGRLARKIRAGSVAINDHLWPFFAPETPWGGIRASGLGRIGGAWGLHAMTDPKVISVKRPGPTREFFWQPATERLHRLFQALIPILYSRRPLERLKAGWRFMRNWFGQ